MAGIVPAKVLVAKNIPISIESQNKSEDHAESSQLNIK